MMPRRTASVLVTLVAAATVAGACGGHDAERRGARADPVTIAVEAPMSGPEAAIGHDILRGVRLAVSQSDASPGAAVTADPSGPAGSDKPTARIVILVADDRASPVRGLRLARELVARHVTAVIGPYDPAVASAVLGTYAKAKIVVLDLSPVSTFARRGASVVPGYDRAASVEAQELVEVLNASSVAVMYDPSYAPTADVAARVRSLLTSAGVAVPVYAGLAPGQSPAAAIAQVAAAHADAWYLTMPGSETAAVSAASTSAGLRGTCLVDLVAGSGPYSPGCLGAGLPSIGQMADAASYSRMYTARFHRTPGTLGAFAYDSTRLLIDTARSARTWRFGPLTAALAHAGGFDGVTGDITIDPGTATRVDAPMVVLEETANGSSKVDPGWAAYSGYSAPGTEAVSGSSA